MQAQDLAGVELLQVIGVEAARLDGKVVQLAFLVALRQDILLDGALRYQAVNVHLPCLANAVAPVLRLWN